MFVFIVIPANAGISRLCWLPCFRYFDFAQHDSGLSSIEVTQKFHLPNTRLRRNREFSGAIQRILLYC